MIIDAAELEDGSILQTDLCIIGAGAAGIAIALQFAASGHRVIMLESGGDKTEPATQALYQGTVEDADLHSPLDRYRARALGGSTALWGGRCVPFDPIDFAARPFIDAAWPIGFDDVARYYPAASVVCETGAFDYRAPTDMQAMIDGFEGQDFTSDSIERFSCPTHFGARYRRRLEISPDIRLITHANATRLLCTPDGTTISEVIAGSLSGKTWRIQARCVVLAMGGLETPRLLLASRDTHAAGIGNAHDLVGRYYMCHIAGTIGNVQCTRGVSHGYYVDTDGVYCRRRLALSAAAQQRLGVGNFVARLHHPEIPDPSHGSAVLSALFLARPFISYEYAKRLYGHNAIGPHWWLGHGRNVGAGIGEIAAFAWFWLTRRTLAARKFPSIVARSKTGRYSLDFHAEQHPNILSRVTLGGDVDALGLPRLHVDWRHCDADISTVQRALAALQQDFSRSGVAELRYDPERVMEAALCHGAYGGHHIGTTRMSATARGGVVDGDCRVHGMRNLFIAGSSVFATSSQANPTLTIVALALRLATHLQESKSLLF